MPINTSIETYNPDTAAYLGAAAHLAVSRLYGYLDKCSPTPTQAMKELAAALTTVEHVRNKIYTDPHGPYIAIPHSPGRVVCQQCNLAALPHDTSTAVALAPMEVANVTDLYTYVPVCGDCLSGWWGVDDCDKPMGAPDYVYLNT